MCVCVCCGNRERCIFHPHPPPPSHQIRVTPAPSKRLDHAGIKVRLLGRIELSPDAAGGPRTAKHDFLTLVRDLAPPGTLTSTLVLPFEFGRVDLPHESYTGRGVRLRYALKASVSRAYAPSVAREWPLAVQAPRSEPPLPEGVGAGGGGGVGVPPASPSSAVSPSLNSPVRLEVGIEDCLHIELAFDRGAYGLGDTVLGRVNFLLVSLGKRKRVLGGQIKKQKHSHSDPPPPPPPTPPHTLGPHQAQAHGPGAPPPRDDGGGHSREV